MNGRKLFVGQLPWAITNDKLKEIFSQVGGVLDAVVIMNRETGQSRGFGFVEMSTEEEAQNAIKNLNGSDVDGRKIVVNLARPKQEGGDKH